MSFRMDIYSRCLWILNTLGIRYLVLPSFPLPAAAQCTKITVNNEFAEVCVKDRKHTRKTNSWHTQRR